MENKNITKSSLQICKREQLGKRKKIEMIKKKCSRVFEVNSIKGYLG